MATKSHHSLSSILMREVWHTMKNILVRATAITTGVLLWGIGNLVTGSVPANGDPGYFGYTVCTPETYEGAHTECGNQVNGQCSGTWSDSYFTENECSGASGNYDGCIPSTTTGTETLATGNCYPISGGDPPVCQPGPASYTVVVREMSDCTEKPAPAPPGTPDA
jgi:hypothetical protein